MADESSLIAVTNTEERLSTLENDGAEQNLQTEINLTQSPEGASTPARFDAHEEIEQERQTMEEIGWNWLERDSRDQMNDLESPERRIEILEEQLEERVERMYQLMGFLRTTERVMSGVQRIQRLVGLLRVLRNGNALEGSVSTAAYSTPGSIDDGDDFECPEVH